MQEAGEATNISPDLVGALEPTAPTLSQPEPTQWVVMMVMESAKAEMISDTFYLM